MHGRLFALVNPRDENDVIGWGIEVTRPEGQEAVVYFREPESRQISWGVHKSAEAAWRCWSDVEPMNLVWPD